MEDDNIIARMIDGKSLWRLAASHKPRLSCIFLEPPDTGTTERGHQTPRAWRYAARISAQLQCQPSHYFTGHDDTTLSLT
jgi:hypothetical protein